MRRPELRLTCCRCRKPIAARSDVYALDGEWQRRYPHMIGTLACARCALGDAWSCRTPGGAYVPGHVPATGQSAGSDFDSWCHLSAYGTHLAMVLTYPAAGVLQGAEDYLRHALARPGLQAELAAQIRVALARRPAGAADLAAAGRR